MHRPRVCIVGWLHRGSRFSMKCGGYWWGQSAPKAFLLSETLPGVSGPSLELVTQVPVC